MMKVRLRDKLRTDEVEVWVEETEYLIQLVGRGKGVEKVILSISKRQGTVMFRPYDVADLKLTIL